MTLAGATGPVRAERPRPYISRVFSEQLCLDIPDETVYCGASFCRPKCVHAHGHNGSNHQAYCLDIKLSTRKHVNEIKICTA